MSAGLSCQAVLSMIMIFHSIVLGSAWLARTSLMASSALLGSIPNRFCSASRRGRIWPGAIGGWLVVHRGRGQFGKFGARCVGVVVMRDIHWRPKTWSSNTCVLVRLRCCATCGFATSLLPLTKSQPVGCVHNGGALSTPMSETASGCSP